MGAHDQPKILVTNQEVAQGMFSGYVLRMLSVAKQVPDYRLLLCEGLPLTLGQIHGGHQVDHQTNGAQAGKALRSQPPRKTLAQ